jgi:alkylation response protein AidB-like acyl-CoA dehydrogenase
LTEDQQAIRKLVRDFAETKIAPCAAKIDEEGHIPEEIIAGMREIGLFGLCYDEKFGGMGAGFTEVALTIEELSKVSAGTGFMLAVHYLCATPISLYGTEEQKSRFLPKLCSGESIGSFAFTEAGTGSDPTALKTTATLVNDGYVLNGGKTFITNASLNGTIVLFALTDNGCSAFVMDKNQEGYSTSSPWDKMGQRGAETVDIHLNQVKIPADSLLGKDGKGFQILLRGISIGKVNMSAIMLGVGEAALDEATKYAKQRIVRGKPLAHLLTIQSLLADAYVRTVASRLMIYRNAKIVEQGMQNLEFESAATKLFVAEAMKQAVDKAFQVHGCYGYVKEFKVERLYRDIRLGEVIEGASELQRVLVAGGLLK